MSVNYTFRIDENVKNEAEQLFEELGMNISTACTVFLKQAIRERKIPFEISAKEPNEDTYKAIEDAALGRNLHGPFENIVDVLEALNAEN